MTQALTPVQAAAYARVQEMLRAYLVERDAEKALACCMPDVVSIGAGAEDTAFSLDQMRDQMQRNLEQDPAPFSIAFESVYAAEHTAGQAITLYTSYRLEKRLSTGVPLRAFVRQTTELASLDGTFFIRSIHVSLPAGSQPGSAPSLGQQQTRLDRHFLSLLSESVPGGMMGGYLEPGLPLYFVNDRMLEHLGYTYREFLAATGGLLIQCIHPNDRTRVEQQITQALTHGSDYTVTYRMLKHGGGFLWILDKGRRILTDDGREAVISVCMDITATVRVENELSFIAQNQIVGLFRARMDNGFTLLYANDCYCRLHGYTRQQLQEKFNRQARTLLHPEDADRVRILLEDAIHRRQDTVAITYRVMRDNGQTVWLYVSADLSRTDDGVMLSGMVINVDQEKRFEQQLRWSEERFRIAIEHTKINVWEYDLRTRSILHTEKSRRTFGREAQLTGVPESIIRSRAVHPDDAQEYAALYEQLHQGAKNASAVVRLRTADGSYRWKKLTYTNIFDDAGRPVRAAAVSEDITEQKEAEQKFFQEEHMREVLSMDVLVSAKINLTQDKVLCLWSNHPETTALEQTVSYTRLFEELLGFLSHSRDRSRCRARFSPEALQRAYREGNQNLYDEYRCVCTGGRILWCSFHILLLPAPGTSDLLAFGYVRNIDECKKTELALRERAERDALTGLYNRQTVEAMIEQRLACQRDSDRQCAFFIIDMDNFKQINDGHGHPLGDRLLQEVGRVLRMNTRGTSIAGRLGGDEFIVFSENIPSRQWAQDAAASLCEKLNLHCRVGDQELCTSASVGVVTAPMRSAAFQQLFQRADSALYEAKFYGKARYSRFGGIRENARFQPPQPTCESCVARRHLGEACMVDVTDDAVLVIDEKNYDILFMNRSAQTEFSVEDYLGHKCYDVLHGFQRPCVFCQKHLPEESGFRTRSICRKKAASGPGEILIPACTSVS